MQLFIWTPLILKRGNFPRDEQNRPYLPGVVLEEAIESSLIYYYIKKDKEIENKVKTYLLKKGLNPEEVVGDIKNIIFEKYPIIKNIKFPEKIKLNPEEVYPVRVEVFNLETWLDEEEFKAEAYKGVVSLDFTSEELAVLKSAGHSYCEALLRIEREFLKDHPLVQTFYDPMLNKIKKWDFPLRAGMWTETEFQGNLLFFWRIKEVREWILKELKIDIRPKKVLFVPREECTTGWCELKTN